MPRRPIASANEVKFGLARLIRECTEWQSDPGAPEYANDSGWFRHPGVIEAMGPALASLHDGSPTVVVGPESRGMAIAMLVAQELSIGIAEIRKRPERNSDSDKWMTSEAAHDHAGRTLTLAVREKILLPGDRVLFVDDWVESGAQAAACKQLVEKSGSTWLGASVLVDGLEDNRLRRELNIKSVLSVREL